MQSGYTGTVKRAPYFDPEQDAGRLHGVLRGLVNDDGCFNTLISSRINLQRREISATYSSVYDRDLIKDIKAKFSGDYEDLLVALVLDPADFDAMCLYKAMKGLGTDEKTMIEILVTRSKRRIQRTENFYQQRYKRKLEDDIKEEISGDFRTLLVKLASGSREDSFDLSSYEKASEDAETLAGLIQAGKPTADVIEILSSRSFTQLYASFSEYEKLTRTDILKTINATYSGDFRDALTAIVQAARYPPEYFAERLYRSMKGAGTDDPTLIRIVVSRSEIDMWDIKKCFKEKHGKSVEEFIEGDTSGCYRKLLLALVSS